MDLEGSSGLGPGFMLNPQLSPFFLLDDNSCAKMDVYKLPSDRSGCLTSNTGPNLPACKLTEICSIRRKPCSQSTPGDAETTRAAFTPKPRPLVEQRCKFSGLTSDPNL